MHHITYNSRLFFWGGHFVFGKSNSCRLGLSWHLILGYSLLMSLPCLFFEKCLTHGS
ncbi:hypothetical protein Hdeb2414_s0001g00031221 [Helianthus debilis subsp. tardiflorus]